MSKHTLGNSASTLWAFFVGFFALGNDVAAASGIFDNLSTCTTTNCAAALINGSILQDTSSDIAPFNLPIFAGAGECIRVEVTAPPGTSTDTDLELVLVAPSGVVWRNDDQGGTGGNRPLLKIASAPNRGWYTLQVSQFNGSISPNTLVDFSIAYGRYNAGNPNCSTPTPPL